MRKANNYATSRQAMNRSCGFLPVLDLALSLVARVESILTPWPYPFATFSSGSVCATLRKLGESHTAKTRTAMRQSTAKSNDVKDISGGYGSVSSDAGERLLSSGRSFLPCSQGTYGSLMRGDTHAVPSKVPTLHPRTRPFAETMDSGMCSALHILTYLCGWAKWSHISYNIAATLRCPPLATRNVYTCYRRGSP